MNETAKKMLSPQEVRDYLINHPDFFLEQQDLFTEINFPHETSGAISLIERQVQVLRNSQKESMDRVSELTATATTNHELLKKMQLLMLKLVVAEDSASLITCLNDLMREQFELDQMYLLMSDKVTDKDLPLTQFLSADQLTKMHADLLIWISTSAEFRQSSVTTLLGTVCRIYPLSLCSSWIFSTKPATCCWAVPKKVDFRAIWRPTLSNLLPI